MVSMRAEISLKLGLGLEKLIPVKFNGLSYNIIYKTESFETFTREILKELSELISHDNIHLYTNAGIDLHTSETELYGIKVHKVSYNSIELEG
tara:strand:- start:1605 stop:1883 length:279 start_codon:yes stop_codon:yes gene_type:complete